MKIGVIAGSTRDNRLGNRVFRWVLNEAQKQDGWEVTALDLKERDLPLLMSATIPAAMGGNYPDKKAQQWSQDVKAQDGFIVVTPEYNHGLPAPLKNALDWLYPEWGNKAAVLVGYSAGNGGGIRAVEQLRLTLGHLGVATCQQVTTIAKAQDNFDESGKPLTENFNDSLTRSLQQLDAWAKALQALH